MAMNTNYYRLNLCRFLIATYCLLLSQFVAAQTCEGDHLIFSNEKDLNSKVISAAESGDTQAQYLLGMAYLNGKGIERNKEKALSMLEKSAVAGNSEAQYLLGEYYAATGKSDADFQKAIDWYQKSIKQDCMPALMGLGILTATGKGVPKNTDAGIQMVTKAAEAGYSGAQALLGVLMITGDLGVNKDLNSGFNWTKRAADAGDTAAELALANLYFSGIGTQTNTGAAIALLESVYNKHDEQAPMAAYFLGWIYMEDKGVPVDIAKSFQWMIIAANKNASDSVQRLKKLTEQLPKQQLATECSVYMDPLFASNSAKEYQHVNASETVRLLTTQKTFYEVYFPDRRLLGFIPKRCLKK